MIWAKKLRSLPFPGSPGVSYKTKKLEVDRCPGLSNMRNQLTLYRNPPPSPLPPLPPSPPRWWEWVLGWRSIVAASQLMAGSPPSPFDQHPFCPQHCISVSQCCIAALYRTLRVGFSPRLFVFVRGSSLSEPCLYPLSLSPHCTAHLHSIRHNLLEIFL